MLTPAVLSFFTKEAAIMTSRDATGIPMSSQQLLDKYNDSVTRQPVDIAKWSTLGALAGSALGAGKEIISTLLASGVINKEHVKNKAIVGAIMGLVLGGTGAYAENKLERALTARFLKGRGIDPERVDKQLSGAGRAVLSSEKVATGMTYEYMKRRKEISKPKPEPVELKNPAQDMHRKHIKGLKQPRLATQRITSAGVKGNPISLGGNPRARLGLKRNQ
jgi:hypothetical protein